MKQKHTIFIACLLATGLTSCEAWLSEVPFDKVAGNELYTTEQGVQEALNGLYLGMTDRSIYGGELTFGFIEALAQHYYISSDHRYEDPAAYNYSTSRSRGYFDAAWERLYGLITSANVFLEQVEANKQRYSPARYNLFRGEALALRVYFHFDLLRLFAPPCTEENKAKRAIPYYDKEMNAPADYLTVEKVTGRLLADISEAITLLAADPVLEGLATGDGFWEYRNFRLNLYAAHVLKARVLLHSGDKPGAYAIASALLGGTLPGSGESVNFMKIFPSILSVLPGFQEPVMYPEIIFGLHDVNRSRVQRDYFNTDLTAETLLLAGNARYIALFTNNDDIRGKGFVEATNQNSTHPLRAIVKYRQGTPLAADPLPYRYEILPLIRKSEVYLIAAEASDNDTDKARWLELLRLERGYLQNNTGAYASSLDQLVQEEYDREFYGEGQYFYFLKRNGKTTIPDQLNKNVTIGSFTLPVPDKETYNRQ
ncbi:MAG: RagB/SusD family nutrient uptake outer membrane protein [Odoribacteraceae bacterium]|jgi:hypothetical protein|nr:RagB/SusD family nutrient uptake outer membrane protein [Odoribacteraceae bacterium]